MQQRKEALEANAGNLYATRLHTYPTIHPVLTTSWLNSQY